MPLTPELKANVLLKRNIDALLHKRGYTRPDLARYCHNSRSWLDKIFSEDRREIPLKYLDRIADFFGCATYQLFQPGIVSASERRQMQDRRSGTDRRFSRTVLSEKPGDVDLMDVIRALSRQGRERAIGILADILNDELRRRSTTPPAHDDEHHTKETKKPRTSQPLIPKGK